MEPLYNLLYNLENNCLSEVGGGDGHMAEWWHCARFELQIGVLW